MTFIYLNVYMCELDFQHSSMTTLDKRCLVGFWRVCRCGQIVSFFFIFYQCFTVIIDGGVEWFVLSVVIERGDTTGALKLTN